MIGPNFRGSIVALVTPMHQDGKIDFLTLDKLVDWHIAQGTHGIVAVGTTGESATLGPSEHVQVIDRCVRRATGRLPIIAGTGSNSTVEAIELSQHAREAGANATLQVVPYYNKPPQRGMLAHFLAIADAVDLPHILYNVPGRCVADMLPETTIEAAKHPRIVGIKDATSDISRVAKLRDGCGEDFALLSGEDGTLYDFMQAGGDGVISVTANLLPAAMAEMCTAMLVGNHAKGKQLHNALMPVHAALFVEPNPIPLKWAMAQAGLTGPGIRLPLVQLAERWHQQLREVVPQHPWGS